MLAPGDLADVRVEVVVPALAALLSGAPGQLSGDAAPLLGPDLAHQLGHAGVVRCGPGSLGTTVEHLRPAVEALHVRLPGDALGHLWFRRLSDLLWLLWTRGRWLTPKASAAVHVARAQRQAARRAVRLIPGMHVGGMGGFLRWDSRN